MLYVSSILVFGPWKIILKYHTLLQKARKKIIKNNIYQK
jgi:hypothetical protein